MRWTPLKPSLVAAGIVMACAAAAPAARAEGVAYLDGREVWIASLDGAQKVRLSAGEGNWETVAQSTDGYVVATRREDPTKVFQTGTFTIWRPDGTVKDAGPLAGKTASDVREVLPVGLALPPGGAAVIVGYANFTFGADLGYFVMPSAARARPVGGWTSVSAVHTPNLVGDRVIGTPNGRGLALQNAGGGLAGTGFTAWPGIDVGSASIDAIDVAESGRTVALGVEIGNPGPKRIIVWPTPGLGQAPVLLPAAVVAGDTGDCFLPASGDASSPSFSLDGSRLAWSDAGGVRIAGTPLVQPTLPPANLCTPSSATVTIAATGKSPSIGGIDVAAIIAARNPAPSSPGGQTGGAPAPGGGGTGTAPGGGATSPIGTPAPGTTVPGSTAPAAVAFVKLTGLKVSSLASGKGAGVQVAPTVSGRATFTLTVEPRALGRKGKNPVTIATGKATLVKGKARTVALKTNATGRKAGKKLRKKRATLTVKVGGTTTSTTVTLT